MQIKIGPKIFLFLNVPKPNFFILQLQHNQISLLLETNHREKPICVYIYKNLDIHIRIKS